MKRKWLVLIVTLSGISWYIFWFRTRPLLIINIHQSSCGMGNQMFRYAAGMGFAEQNPGFHVCWTGMEWFSAVMHEDSFFLHHVIPSQRLPQCSSWDSAMGKILLPRFAPPAWTFVPFTPTGATLIDGAMETYRYFPRHTNNSIFTLKWGLSAAHWMKEHNLTSAIHVQRGDYTKLAAPVEFYNRTNVQRAVVVTDDPEWIENFPSVFGQYVLSEGHTPGFDMALVAAATETVVIGIGTFAWWGAYLSNAERVVYYPWQAGYDSDAYVESDHMPDHWVKGHASSPSH